jgi:hypothetical protein
MIKNGISIYLFFFNRNGIGIKKGSWDETRMHPRDVLFDWFRIKNSGRTIHTYFNNPGYTFIHFLFISKYIFTYDC